MLKNLQRGIAAKPRPFIYLKILKDNTHLAATDEGTVPGWKGGVYGAVLVILRLLLCDSVKLGGCCESGGKHDPN